MMDAEPEFVRAVGRAYLLGIAGTSILLWLWLLGATGVLLRISSRGGIKRSAILAGVYSFLGYIGYLALLDPITLFFMNRVAIVEPFVLHPAWVRIGLPCGSFIAWFGILRAIRLKAASTLPDEAHAEVAAAKSAPPN